MKNSFQVVLILIESTFFSLYLDFITFLWEMLHL